MSHLKIIKCLFVLKKIEEKPMKTQFYYCIFMAEVKSIVDLKSSRDNDTIPVMLLKKINK